MGKMKGINSLAQVKGMKDAISDTVKHVTFNAPAFISVTRASEQPSVLTLLKTELNKFLHLLRVMPEFT